MTEEIDRSASLPTIGQVSLDSFDLYSRQPNLAVEVEAPVICLIGANGLGKSTFLNLINYAITGAVPDPDRGFKSAQDYLKNTSRPDRIEDYFGGRLSESARPLTTVSVSLCWPKRTVILTREILADHAVVSLSSINHETDQNENWEAKDEAGSDLRRRYEALILSHTGLNDFAQFVFLMHFVATFDEGRHLLMWDDAALTNALYLAFGSDAETARAADKLQHDLDRESSRGRNVRFSARHLTERINQLQELLQKNENLEQASDTELRSRHEKLIKELDEATDRTRRKESALRDADLKWTDLSARLTELQLEYRRLFSERLAEGNSAEHHPLIRATLSEDKCAICGTDGVSIQIKSSLANDECPLCLSTINVAETDDKVVNRLKNIDTDISNLRGELSSVLKSRERLSDELAAARGREDAATDALRQFEDEEGSALDDKAASSDFRGVRDEIERLERERQEFIEQSKAHYRKRDALRKELRKYEEKLSERYETGSRTFVPRFRELAEEFIGIPIDIELEHRSGVNDAGFGLRMRMDDQLRLQAEDVSESQRFFIDIALRMALAEFTTSGPATLLIDTPEGSLDIAYEARAGAMFSKFVNEGNRLIMTANLRSSELVLRLANLQRRKGMQVLRMTEWTDLSEVQQTEEKLFAKAYDDIEAALG